MKFRIVLLYDDNRAEIGQLTEGVARAYCTRHGYDLGVYRSTWRPDMPATFSITKAMAAEMEMRPDVDWFVRLDADSIIVNQDITLESIVEGQQCSLLGSADANGLCMGIFFIRNTGWAARLLGMLDFLGEMAADQWRNYDGHNTYEQSTIKCLIRHFPRIGNQVAILPQNLIQNPRTAFSDSAFIMHYWSNSGLPMIAAKMREIIANGWSRKGFYQWGEKWSS